MKLLIGLILFAVTQGAVAQTPKFSCTVIYRESTTAWEILKNEISRSISEEKTVMQNNIFVSIDGTTIVDADEQGLNSIMIYPWKKNRYKVEVVNKATGEVIGKGTPPNDDLQATVDLSTDTVQRSIKVQCHPNF